MNRREFWVLRGVTDDELEAGLSELLGAGARVEARIVAHLAEVEARRLHLLAGYSSLYDYCRKRLGLSDYEAFIRIAAARVARKYPVVFEMLEQRQLHLTAIYEVREFLTAENHRELLGAVSGKTKRQIREVLAQRFPQADLPATSKKLPGLEPLSPGRYRLELTLNAVQKEKLELARDLLSHANGSGDLAIVLERALDELISRLEKRRFGRAQPRLATAPGVPVVSNVCVPEQTAPDVPGSETRAQGMPSVIGRRKHISHATRRDLLARDGVRCAFVSRDGQRCDERAFLQSTIDMPGRAAVATPPTTWSSCVAPTIRYWPNEISDARPSRQQSPLGGTRRTNEPRKPRDLDSPGRPRRGETDIA